jgi:hypothetical protein
MKAGPRREPIAKRIWSNCVSGNQPQNRRGLRRTQDVNRHQGKRRQGRFAEANAVAAAIDGPSDLSGHKTTRQDQDIDALKKPDGPIRIIKTLTMFRMILIVVPGSPLPAGALPPIRPRQLKAQCFSLKISSTAAHASTGIAFPRVEG